MPTASSAMTLKLVSDFRAVTKLLTDANKQLKSIGDSPSQSAFDKLRKLHDAIEPQIDKFERGLGLKPAEFPDEADYKKRRTDVTNMASAATKVAKAIAAEAAALADEVTVLAVSAAKSELTGKDKALAQALTMVARGEKGRSGPKVDKIKEYKHIHIGGNAQSNLLFRTGSKPVVLGIIDFHMEKGLDDGKYKQIEKVAGRGGSTVTLKINGPEVAEKK